ncbi:MAG: urease accessory protein UreF [Rhodospirillaceae bacterium]|nr:urease accessory protein UreF [Rhodospirillaceae bacterium]
MPEPRALLAALQHGDSFFPSGAVSFSWGLETLVADGLVDGARTLERFLEGQLGQRWNCCDRAALAAAHAAADDPNAILAVDRTFDVLAQPAELLDGSKRAGAALLGVHARIETPGAEAYRALVLDGAAPGHLPVVQGLVWRGAGLDAAEAAAVAAHGFMVGALGAAVRLGVIGHIDGQRILARLRPLAEALLAVPAPSLDRVATSTPAADIAAMRHETQVTRLFAN